MMMAYIKQLLWANFGGSQLVGDPHMIIEIIVAQSFGDLQTKFTKDSWSGDSPILHPTMQLIYSSRNHLTPTNWEILQLQALKINPRLKYCS